jgi:hypothetical protein
MTLSRKSPNIVVKIGGAIDPYLEVISIRQSLGGQNVDTAVFTRDFETRGNFLVQEMALSSMTAWETNPIVEILINNRDGAPVIIHRGQLVAANADLDQHGERVTYTSRTDWHLLASSSVDELHVTAVNALGSHSDAYVTMGPLAFNPYVDGIALPNRHKSSELPVTEDGIPRNVTVTEMLAGGMEFWHLAEIVEYVLKTLNGGDTPFANNPSLDVLKATLSTDRNLVRHLEVDFTKPLPAVLDHVLEAYGYTWFLNHNAQKRGTVFEFVDKRTTENARQFAMHAYGEEPHSGGSPTEAKAYSLQYDISSNAANLFYIVHGGTLVEASFELYPAWNKDYDSLEPDELVETGTDVQQTPEKGRVFRDWVLNEGGNYNTVLQARGISTTAGAVQLSTAFDQGNTNSVANTDDVGWHIRRRFLPQLTLDADGSPEGSGRGGVRVEWSDDGGVTWYPITGDPDQNPLFPNDSAVSVLVSECGIRFSSGERPPEEMFARRDQYNTTTGNKWWTMFKFRVTATVQGDDVVRTTRTLSHAQSQSFLSYWKPYFINSRHMRSAVVSKKSVNYAAVTAGTRKAAQVNMQEQADLEADRVAEVYGLASCTGTITLEGLEQGIQWLGCTVESMMRRNVNFDISPPGNTDRRYPLVIAADYHISRQEVILTLDTDRTVRSTRRGRRGNVGWVRPQEGKLRE